MTFRLLYVGEADQRGSGYSTIAYGLIRELERRGHDVLGLMFDYRGEQHPFKAPLVPTDQRQFALQVQAAQMAFKPDAVVVAFDLTAHESFAFLQRTFCYVGIFPIESDPLVHPSSWTACVDTMDVALCESRFGTKLLTDAGLRATYFPVGIDLDHWRQPSPEEREKARNDWGVADRFVVLTVCDNHERKNLPAMLAAFALATGRELEWPPESGQMRKLDNPIDNGYFIINTKRRPSRVGFDVQALAERFGVAEDCLILQHELKGGMDVEGLRSLYWAADAFLLLSRAEGLCVMPGSRVWTDKGTKAIEGIQVDDRVLTHKGRLKPVVETFAREYAGPIVNLQMRYGLPPLRLTPNHLVRAIFRQHRGGQLFGKRRFRTEQHGWVRAEELRVGDFVVYPKAFEEPPKTSIRISDYVDVARYEDGTVALQGRNQFGSVFRHPMSRRRDDRITVDDDLLTIIGYYIAEGCTQSDSVLFSFHTKETAFQDRVKGAMLRKFGGRPKEYFRDRHRYSMAFYDSMVARLLHVMCGPSSHEKHLPDWALWLTEAQLLTLLECLHDGDGYLQPKSKMSERTLRYSTVSRQLADEVQFMWSRLGIMANIQSESRKEAYEVRVPGADLHLVPFIAPEPSAAKRSARYERLDDGLAVPIKGVTVEEYSGQVYNLEVESDHSYTLQGGAVHNCLPVLEAMACGLVCVAGDWTGTGESLAGGRGFAIPAEYTYADPFGNQYRRCADVVKAAEALVSASRETWDFRKRTAAEYVAGFTWAAAGQILEEALTEAIAKRAL